MTNLELETDKQELARAIKQFVSKYDLIPVVTEWSNYTDDIEIIYKAK